MFRDMWRSIPVFDSDRAGRQWLPSHDEISPGQLPVYIPRASSMAGNVGRSEHASSDAPTSNKDASAASEPNKVTSIVERIARAGNRPFYTFEIFPPKTDPGTHNLIDRVTRMCSSLDPSWVHVTWGAGGSTQTRSLQLCEAVKAVTRADGSGANIDVCLHLTCTNMEKRVLDETLEVGQDFQSPRRLER